MNVFTDVYKKNIEVLKAPALHQDWKTIEADLKALMNADGPDLDKAKVLEDLRDRLRKAADEAGGIRSKAKAKEMLRAAQPDKTGYQDRAALLKQMKHFYMASRRGAQSVWVQDFPKGLGKWNYDDFQGESEAKLASKLAKGNEVFGAGNRKMMFESLQQARKWSSDTEIRLGEDKAATRTAIQRWFHTAGASADDVEATRKTLLEGFKKITAATNSGRVIFSDRPHLRVSGDYDDTYASVNALDKMPVVYIYQLFLKTGRRTLSGRIPKMWLCALTVVHELSHKCVKTEDIRYDTDGLKPSAAFPAESAIKNADSWAYFCADLLGHVPKSALEEAWS